MTITVLPDGWISDSFQLGEPPYIYDDALVMPAEEYYALTPEQIQAMKQERYDNWYQAVTNPPPPPPIPPIFPGIEENPV